MLDKKAELIKRFEKKVVNADLRLKRVDRDTKKSIAFLEDKITILGLLSSLGVFFSLNALWSVFLNYEMNKTILGNLFLISIVVFFMILIFGKESILKRKTTLKNKLIQIKEESLSEIEYLKRDDVSLNNETKYEILLRYKAENRLEELSDNFFEDALKEKRDTIYKKLNREKRLELIMHEEKLLNMQEIKND